jgi:ribonuclease-3
LCSLPATLGEGVVRHDPVILTRLDHPAAPTLSTPDPAETVRARALTELARQIGHEFRDPELLTRALVHSSMGNEGKASYERLEFLGDAVLGFLVADHLYRMRPEIPEGELTDRRAKIVAREPLAAVARRLGLARYLEAGRGLSLEELDSPRIQADVLEAILGAIYLDGGVRAARRFVRQHLIDPSELRLELTGERDPKSRLLHYAQAHGHGQPAYRMVGTEGPDHAQVFTVTVSISGADIASGDGRSKQKAEMAAADAALRLLRRRDLGTNADVTAEA